VTDCTAAIYVRISQDRTGAGLGVERQEADCRELAARVGRTVSQVYGDNDLSAYRAKSRPAYQRLLADIRGGLVGAVIAWHTDRLHRSPAELEEYIATCEGQGVPTLTVRAGELDLETAAGRMVARMLGAAARHESEQKAERLRRQRRQIQAAGLRHGGRRPFGYNIAPGGMLVPHPVEGPAVQDAVRRLLAGDSVHSIARAWNAAGLTTSTGCRWTASNLGQMITRPSHAALVGNRKGKIVGDAQWEPLVERETWQAFIAMMSDPARRTNRGGVSKKLAGSGIYVCGKCGARMCSGGHGPRGQDRYRCAKGCMHRLAEPIDRFVRAVICEVLVRDGVSLLPEPDDVTAERTRLASLRARQVDIANSFAALELTGEQFRAANDRASREVAELEAVIARRTAGSVLAGVADAPDPAAEFLRADIDRQRVIIDDLVIVTIVPVPVGHRPGPHSVRVEPKR
jgi:DNA invertase Pin-like site-specific DNA recombinase